MAVPATHVAAILNSSANGGPPQYPELPGLIVHAQRTAPALAHPDIGPLAKWSVSSYKFGFGPECLQDGDPDTFWHSDGPQPHFVTVEFPRKVPVQKLSISLSYPLDDSYTPAALSIRAGTGPGDMQETRIITADKPDGWITFDICTEPNDDGEGFRPIHAYVLQVVVLGNHMNGKDTHVRGMRVLGPLEDNASWDDPFPWKNDRFRLYEQLR
ncbi:anaphase-promoting complex subunit 10 [Vararia minispora EC-137]|uniref:Anaphase-promoting complex subunit 10 n=1 Tax=Vararia minispora EC-137 TaxID=1314806 RepID=A0ACB8QV12_9AGAM|nr:anaphase-promoting complex subunit 10 [Vararia minispora EC-137]